MLLGFTAGYALRASWRPRPEGDRWFLAVALLSIAIVICSLTMVLAAAPGPGVASIVDTWASHGFPIRAGLPESERLPLRLPASVIFVAASEECPARQGSDRRVLSVLLVSVAAAGALDVRAIEIALRHPPFPQSVVEVHRWVRISASSRT